MTEMYKDLGFHPTLLTTPTSYSRTSRQDLEEAGIMGIRYDRIEGAFWWVWKCSMAIEEPLARKQAFGRIIMLELSKEVPEPTWVIIEE
jgi:hypothetical protein